MEKGVILKNYFGPNDHHVAILCVGPKDGMTCELEQNMEVNQCVRIGFPCHKHLDCCYDVEKDTRCKLPIGVDHKIYHIRTC